MAIKSYGVAVSVATNDVGDLTDVNIGGSDVNYVDITTHDSASGYKEFTSGLKEGGTLDLTGAYKPADTGQAYLLANEGASAACVVTFTDSSTASFTAVVGGYNVSNPLDDKVEFTCSMKITGPITWA
jgi:predicted secreted protein